MVVCCQPLFAILYRVMDSHRRRACACSISAIVEGHLWLAQSHAGVPTQQSPSTLSKTAGPKTKERQSAREHITYLCCGIVLWPPERNRSVQSMILSSNFRIFLIRRRSFMTTLTIWVYLKREPQEKLLPKRCYHSQADHGKSDRKRQKIYFKTMT